MTPRDDDETELKKIAAEDAGLEPQDWNDLEGAEVDEEAALPENGGFREGEPEPGDQPEEDDDNPYQESDTALPDDQEERAITRRLASILAGSDKS